MPSIAIITDTDASLPADLAERRGIRQVPITVHFGQEIYETGVDIDDERLFDRVDREGALPTTSAPSPGQFVQAYRAAFQAGAEAVICFCVSSQVSGTYAAARAARDVLSEHSITVVDTYSLSLGQGFPVLAAAEAAQAGASKKEIVARAEDVRDRTHLFAALSTLKYLAMSGRVGHLAAGMAGLLSVKPILTIQDGKLDLLERVRTQRRAWRRVIDLVRESVDGQSIERLAVVHADAAGDAARFEERLRAALPVPETILRAEITPGLSVHAGKGMVGVAAVVKKE